MKILLDTNIVVDYILRRQPFEENAVQIFNKIAQSQCDAFLTSNVLTDIYYIERKQFSVEDAKSAILSILGLIQVMPVDGQDCRKALVSPITDFEDALLVTCAERSGINYIVTRDAELLRECELAIAPADFLKLFHHC